MRTKRELGLLYRVRDLFRVSQHLYQFVRDSEAAPHIPGSVDVDKVVRTALLQTAARALAIETGKQNSDYENFGILLEDLDNRSKKGKRSWPRKTEPCASKSAIPTTKHSQN